MKHIFKKQAGFTLIELAVVVVIISTLMVLILPKLSLFSKSQALEDEASRLQTALRVAQNNAASGIKCNSTVPASNWYLKFADTTTYYLETVCSGSEVGALTPTPTPPVSTRYAIASGISVKEIKLDSCTITAGSVGGVRASFTNIASLVNLANAGCPGDPAKMTITLQINSDPGKTANVVVEKGGPIYVSSN